MKTILITGGAGFVGSCLVRQLVSERAARVINIDALTYAGNLDSLSSVSDDPLHVFLQGDVCDGDFLVDVLRQYQPSAVIHLAAESHVDRSIDDPAKFVQTNVQGTFILLESAKRYCERLSRSQRDEFRLLHVSSDEVYGSLGPCGAFTETTPYAPNSPYSASKAAADHFARAYFHTFGLPVLTTVCSNNYGPYQFPEKLIPLMILNAIEGKPLPLYGDGQNVRDWLYVEDHCRALRIVLEKGEPGEVYNVGGSCDRTNLTIVETICKLVDQLVPDLKHSPCSDLISFVTDRPGHDRRYAIDSSKLQTELGWQPRQDLESGLELTVRWYLENSTWVERVTSGVYRRQRLGLTASR